MASHVIFQYNVLAIDETHNTWTNIIVEMTIRRLLGSRDDKEKIGVARPKGPPWNLFGQEDQELKRPWRNPSQRNQDRDTFVSPVEPTLRKLHTSVHWLGARLGVLVTPVEPTPGKLNTSVQWTQQLRQNLYIGWTDARYWWTSVQLSRELVFQQLHSPVKPTLHRLITSVDWGSHWSING